jgi:hypothetical protein
VTFRDDHVHAALIVSPAGYLEAVVDVRARAQVEPDPAVVGDTGIERFSS